MISFLKKAFKKKTAFMKDGFAVQYAFTCGGIDYYEVETIYKLPYTRGVAAKNIYEEVKMKCDYDYLKAHVTAIDNIFTNSKKLGFAEISNIKKLNDQLSERLFHIIDTDLIYKLASVAFFDKQESVTDYDLTHARKKIAHWKKHASVQDFFLQEPMQRLIPFLKQPDVNFQTYSDLIKTINQIHWEAVFSLLSVEERKTFSEAKDFFVAATLPESPNLLN
jgi:hypothetical protein